MIRCPATFANTWLESNISNRQNDNIHELPEHYGTCTKDVCKHWWSCPWVISLTCVKMHKKFFNWIRITASHIRYQDNFRYTTHDAVLLTSYRDEVVFYSIVHFWPSWQVSFYLKWLPCSCYKQSWEENYPAVVNNLWVKGNGYA